MAGGSNIKDATSRARISRNEGDYKTSIKRTCLQFFFGGPAGGKGGKWDLMVLQKGRGVWGVVCLRPLAVNKKKAQVQRTATSETLKVMVGTL